MADTPSVVTPCRLASGTLLKAREAVQPMAHMLNKNLVVDLEHAYPTTIRQVTQKKFN
ncbi:MAG: hypothetical protein MI862_29145 [Desulfobacterales bacterium]|nr:hypothetical protein [Desulfobacterales bacterium]